MYRLRSKLPRLCCFARAPTPEHGEECVQGVMIWWLCIWGMLDCAALSPSSLWVLSLWSFGIDPLGSAQSMVGWIIFAG